MIDDATLEALERAALAAPRGPYWYGDIQSVAGGSLYDDSVMIAAVMWDNSDPEPVHRKRTRTEADALGHYMATLSPNVILSLITELRTLRATD